MGFADLARNTEKPAEGLEELRGQREPSAEEPIEESGIALEEGLAATALAFDDYRAVIRHCSRIVQIRQDHFEAWFNLGFARQKTGESEEAVFAYHRAARLQPDDPRPWVNLGLVREALDDLEGAREAYQQALEVDPVHVQALWNMGLASERGEAWDDAEALYARLSGVVEPGGDPAPAEAWFRLGLARLRRQDAEGALDAFNECLRTQPGWKEALLNRGLALAGAQRNTEARQDFERVIEMDPGCEEAVCALAGVALESGDWETALGLRKRLLEARGTLPELTYNLALALDNQGRHLEAVRLYSEALKERPKFPEALLNLGHVLDHLGRHAEAVECWKRAMGLNPEYAAAYFRHRE